MMKYLRSKSTIIAIIAGILGISLILWAWQLPPFESAIETTDNAYVKGFVTILSPQVSGNIADVRVKDFERVQKDQLLIVIDPAIYQQRLDQSMATLNSQKAALSNSHQQEESAKAQIRSSQAQIASATAAFHKAELNWKRIEPLTKRGVASQSDSDSARASLDQAQASLDQASAALDVSQQNLNTILVSRGGLEAAVEGARAAVELAQIDLDHTKIYAPRSGRVGEVGAKLGQYVSVGTQLVAVVPDDIWIIANYKETQLRYMKIGQPVKFSVDALGGEKMTGRVVRFSPAAGQEFAVLKSDNATGNFTKVAQRISVRIEIDPGQPDIDRLSPGMSVITHVNTSAPGIIQVNDETQPLPQNDAAPTPKGQ